MKAQIRVTMTFDIEYPVSEGETEHGGLDIQLMDLRREILSDPLDIVLEYKEAPDKVELEFRGTVP